MSFTYPSHPPPVQIACMHASRRCPLARGPLLGWCCPGAATCSTLHLHRQDHTGTPFVLLPCRILRFSGTRRVLVALLSSSQVQPNNNTNLFYQIHRRPRTNTPSIYYGSVPLHKPQIFYRYAQYSGTVLFRTRIEQQGALGTWGRFRAKCARLCFLSVCFPITFIFQLNSWEIGKFYLCPPSGEAVVTGDSFPPPRYMPSFLSRVGFATFPLLIDFHRLLRTDTLSRRHEKGDWSSTKLKVWLLCRKHATGTPIGQKYTSHLNLPHNPLQSPTGISLCCLPLVAHDITTPAIHSHLAQITIYTILQKTDSTIAPPPKKQTAIFFNERFMAYRHEERVLCRKKT